MLENWIFNSDTLLENGFFGTRALFYADSIILYIVLLPILVLFVISMLQKGYAKISQLLHILLFLATLASWFYFGYMVHTQGGVDLLLKKSTIAGNRAYIFMAVHLLIVTIMTFKWFFTLTYAMEDKRRRALPGMYSRTHMRSGRGTLFWMFLTSLSSFGIYWMLFMA